MRNIYIRFKSLRTIQNCGCNHDYTKSIGAIFFHGFVRMLEFGYTLLYRISKTLSQGCVWRLEFEFTVVPTRPAQLTLLILPIIYNLKR